MIRNKITRVKTNIFFKSFLNVEYVKVDIKKTYEENVNFYPRDSISYKDKVPSSSITNVYFFNIIYLLEDYWILNNFMHKISINVKKLIIKYIRINVYIYIFSRLPFIIFETSVQPTVLICSNSDMVQDIPTSLNNEFHFILKNLRV